MPNLLDTIRQNSQPPVQPQVTDQTQSLSNLMRAKSGKSVGGGDVGQSNLGEAAAVNQTQQTMQNQIAPQAAIQNAGLQQQQSQQNQATQTQLTGIGQQRQFNALDNKLKTTALLNQFQQDSGKLDLQKNAAQVNQFAQGLRLQNNQYVDNLQREGAKARLDDQNSFNEQLKQQVFGDSEDVLKQQLGDKSILDASNQDFERAIGQMNVDQANYIFQTEKKAAAERAPYEAAGNIFSAGAGAAGTKANSSEGNSAQSGGSAGGPDASAMEGMV